jgi:drug/metabolite transporter (DMT)-like permease
MKPLMIVGVVLIVIGVIALAYGGLSFTTSEKVAEVGPLKLEREKTRSIPLPPILGGLALIGGVVLLIVGARRG